MSRAGFWPKGLATEGFSSALLRPKPAGTQLSPSPSAESALPPYDSPSDRLDSAQEAVRQEAVRHEAVRRQLRSSSSSPTAPQVADSRCVLCDVHFCEVVGRRRPGLQKTGVSLYLEALHLLCVNCCKHFSADLVMEYPHMLNLQ